MDYESPSATAARLDVTVRAVQKWAKDGKIQGAVRMGRQWLIPADAKAPEKNSTDKAFDMSALMPFLSKSFTAENVDSFIEGIMDAEARELALAEYYYYTGQVQKAAEIAELYLSNPRSSLALSAGFIYIFANISAQRLSFARLGFANLKKLLEKAVESASCEKQQAGAVLVNTAACVLLHTSTAELPPLEEELRFLSEGLRHFGAYVLAHKAYLDKNYDYALGVINLSLAIKNEKFSMTTLYLKLMKCVVLMCLRRSQEAKACFGELLPWLDAGFYQPFAEHHGLLQGVIEAELKSIRPTDYKNIVSLVKNFSTGWSLLHNELTESSVTVHLSATEFAVAMLFNRGWSVKEIAAHMNISPRMVKHHLSVTYEKLDVSNREELGQYLLK